MAHRSIGRCVSIIELRGIALALLMSLAGAAFGAPGGAGEHAMEDLAAALDTAEGAWVDTVLNAGAAREGQSTPYDEQIFTELSPILDSLEAIKLPEDQLLTD